MTLASDKIELAQQIADDLKDAIEAGPHVYYGSNYYTKSDYCKNLIKPLIKKYNIEVLLESLPTQAAKPIRERYSRLMSCFDQTGELLNQDLSPKTIVRYMENLVKELRNLEQGGKQNITVPKEKAVRPGPRIKHSDEKMKQVMISFEKFKVESIDTKQAWNKVAEHHGFKSGIAARQACYRFRKKRNK